MTEVSFKALADCDLTEILWHLCGRDAETIGELENSPHNIASWDQRAMAMKDTLRSQFLIDLDDPVHAYVFIMATSILHMPLLAMDRESYLPWAKATFATLRTIARTMSERIGEAELGPDARCVSIGAQAAIEAGMAPKPGRHLGPPPPPPPTRRAAPPTETDGLGEPDAPNAH